MSAQLTEQEKAEGWIEWDGDNRRPVDGGSAVVVRFRNGENCLGIGSDYKWRHSDCVKAFQIIAYKIMDQENSKNNDDNTQSAFNVQIGGDHYKRLAIQPAEYCFKNNIGHLAGDAIAYITRYSFKNGVEDLKKAQHSLDLLIELENGKSQ